MEERDCEQLLASCSREDRPGFEISASVCGRFVAAPPSDRAGQQVASRECAPMAGDLPREGVESGFASYGGALVCGRRYERLSASLNPHARVGARPLF